MPPYDPYRLPELRVVELQARKYFAAIGLGAYATEALALEFHRDETFGLVERLTTRLLTHQLAADSETVTVRVPATWRDHFKHQYAARWWARWLVRRRPARYTGQDVTVRLTRYATYPGADAAPRAAWLKTVVLVDDTTVDSAGPWAWERTAPR
jgi:hypothetical protein